jgi:fructose 5-dehydrogenase small subunit
MVDRYPDDSPTSFNHFRRKVLIGGALLAGGLAVRPVLPANSAQPALASESVAQFMVLSNLLIQHHLDAVTGKRMAAALSWTRPSFFREVSSLLAIASKKSARIVEDFFPDVPDGPLKETALSIISAWYMGVAVETFEAEVFAFEHALMYQPTRDIMTIPSYAKSRPNGWNAEAPPLEDMPEF